jgi:hypothetical protein
VDPALAFESVLGDEDAKGEFDRRLKGVGNLAWGAGVLCSESILYKVRIS